MGIELCFRNINSPFIATASLFLAVIREPASPSKCVVNESNVDGCW